MAREQLREATKQRTPATVTFLGHMGERDQLARVYANSYAFVHLNPREPFGIAPLEAMASGLPIVVPNEGGVLSYATPENAWLAAPDSDAFTAAIERATTNTEERQKKIQAALTTAEAFRWQNVTDSLLLLYADLFAASNEPPLT